jgi:hypothetical protein
VIAAALVVGAVMLIVTGLTTPGLAQSEVDLALRSLSERASRWRCDPVRTVVCSSDGCEDIKPTVWVVLDFKQQSYERCDGRGCNARAMLASHGGIFTAATAGPSAFVKALNDGSDFVDVATLGTTLYANFGRCRPDER